ncbi:TRIM56 [Mytilus coruscus]|uniref:TRIM56 n=1 Tax=Mytilus coruscus TaxID=42192 RepID=A0A6J8AMW5_MYTCO|nr:TRIM56 [Mytilus coruscus]
MALSRPFNDQTELFTCQICNETFKVPKILPCLHTFCEQCIHEFIISTGRKKEPHSTCSRKEFSCPTCKTIIKPTNTKSDIDTWAADLPHNVSIREMIAKSNGENKKCGACKRHYEISEAKFWCEICEEAFCDKCNDMHSRMKLSALHNVIPVEEFASLTYGMVVNAIPEHCYVHPSNLVDVFCCDHKIICCGSCVSTMHRRCKRVMTIASVMTSVKYQSLPEKINEIKQAVENLLKEKDQEKAGIKLATEYTEEEATKFLEQLKSKLDNLFDTFVKQLHMFRDEKYTSFNVRMRLLEQFGKNLDHWIRSIEVVEKFGTKTQLFILVEKIKHHIASNVSEITRVHQRDTLVELSFQKKGIFSQLETMVEIGTFKTYESPIFGQMIDIYKRCAGFGLNCYPKFENANVTFVESICVTGSKFTCGVCIDEKYMIIGDAGPQKKMYVVEKHSGCIVSTTDIHGDVKRLCYDKKSKQLFISCYSEELYKAEVKAKEIVKLTKNPFNKDHIGALFSSNNEVYVVVNRAIKKFSINADSNEMSTCFNTNTGCGLNGMNVIGKYIVFTTADKEIKCSTLQGKNKFCYKNEKLESPECIAVLSSGLTVVVDRANGGSLNLLSEDGLKHRRILEKFKNVNNPTDIWLDGNEELVYVAGGQYIDAYRIITDQQNDIR